MPDNAWNSGIKRRQDSEILHRVVCSCVPACLCAGTEEEDEYQVNVQYNDVFDNDNT